jgi:hypothetical protein
MKTHLDYDFQLHELRQADMRSHLYTSGREQKNAKTDIGAECNLLALAFQIEDDMYLLSSKIRL